MKERNGQFSIVSPNEQVTDVLKTAGLWKLWSVVEDREEAVYELGVSRAAIVEKRERRFLVFVAVPCSVIVGTGIDPDAFETDGCDGCQCPIGGTAVRLGRYCHRADIDRERFRKATHSFVLCRGSGGCLCCHLCSSKAT